MENLPDSARHILIALIRYYERENQIPTYEELAEESGYSVGGVQRQVANLDRAGFVRRSRKARGMRILRDGDGTPYRRIEWRDDAGHSIYGSTRASNRDELTEAESAEPGVRYIALSRPMPALGLNSGDVVRVEERPARPGELTARGLPIVASFKRVR